MLCTPAHRHRNRRILRRGLMLVGAAILAVLLPAPVSAQTGVDTPAGIVRALYAAHAPASCARCMRRTPGMLRQANRA